MDTTINIPRTTIRSWYEEAKAESQTDEDHEDEDLDELELFDHTKDDKVHKEEKNQGQKTSLTTPGDRLIMQNVATARDNNNKGMPRKEMVGLLSDI